MLGRIVLTNKIVSKTLNKDEKEVESVMKFFFKELKTEFEECKHSYVYVKDLGTFGINANMVGKRLILLIHKLQWFRNNKEMIKKPGYYDNATKGLTKEIFFLFNVRRMVKRQNKENQQLRKDGKIINDIERKLVQAGRQE